jgi:Subtilisin inhibitor-like
MRVIMKLALGTALLGLAGCAGSGSTELPAEPSSGSDAAGGGTQLADDNLQITLDRGDGTEPEVYTLDCLCEPAGDHPAPDAACAHLAGLDEPFAPLDEDLVCTEQYGGPQTAHVIGRWNGTDIDLELDRTDGCAISQWDSLGPLLPGPVG